MVQVIINHKMSVPVRALTIAAISFENSQGEAIGIAAMSECLFFELEGYIDVIDDRGEAISVTMTANELIKLSYCTSSAPIFHNM